MEQKRRLFILRCWQEGSETVPGDAEWRFSLEMVGEPEGIHGFAYLQDLLTFLEVELRAADREIT